MNDALVGDSAEVLFILGIVLLLGALFSFFWAGWRITHRPGSSRSPYNKRPLRLCGELTYPAAEKLQLYVLTQGFDNLHFNVNRAAVCRETGRIFSNVVTPSKTIIVGKSFLKKYWKGSLVSWGSLTAEQKVYVRLQHHDLEGFQIEFSCPKPRPEEIDPPYIATKPGPLYVDLRSNVLVGWKCVPGTDLEVIVVQKPVMS